MAVNAKPKNTSSTRRARAQRKTQSIQKGKADFLDELAEFENFRSEFYPVLLQDIKSGMSAEEIRKKWEVIVQSRLIMQALRGDVSAGKDLLDRTSGKPKETKQVDMQVTNLSDEELDNLIKSEEAVVDSLEDQDAGAREH